MTESWSCYRRSTAPDVGMSTAVRTAAVGTAASMESSATAAAGTTSTAPDVGMSTAVRTAAVGTAVNTAAVGTATTVEFTAAGLAMAATMRATAVGPAAMRTAAVRTFSAMLSERGVGGASERDRGNGCKQEAYG